VLAAALVLGLKLGAEFHPLGLIGVFAALFLMSVGLSSLFVLTAIRSKRWETQMAVMNSLNLPLLFASNALFPTKLMPDWLSSFAKINPVIYGTDVARQLLVFNPSTTALVNDFIFLGAFAILFAVIGIALSWRYLSK